VARTGDGVSVFLGRGASLFLSGLFRRAIPTNSPLEDPIMDGQLDFSFSKILPKSIFRILRNAEAILCAQISQGMQQHEESRN